MSNIVAIVGPSCSGKDTLQKDLMSLGVPCIRTYTTRPRRLGESEEGQIYLTDAEWDNCRKVNAFISTASYIVDGGQIWRYGWAKNEFVRYREQKDIPFVSVILPLDVCRALIKQEMVDQLIMLRCNPFTAIYRYLSRDPDYGTHSIDREVFRRVGEDAYTFREEIVHELQYQSSSHFVPIFTYDTTERMLDASYILKTLGHWGKKYNIKWCTSEEELE